MEALVPRKVTVCCSAPVFDADRRANLLISGHFERAWCCVE